jgi:hypothetical protein
MEQLPSTNKFLILNFNLKKIIFSYLSRQDQRIIYWINKKLRNLLPDSPLKINIDSLRKCSTYKLYGEIKAVLEHSDETFSFFTERGIELLEIKNNRFNLIKTLPIKSDYWTHPIQFENGDIIFRSRFNQLTHFDKDFNIIQRFEESHDIYSLCNLSELSFAVGFYHYIKVYSKNENTQKYEVKEYKCPSFGIFNIHYLPKQNFLLISSYEKKINVLSLSEGSIKKLTDHNSPVTSLISLNDETFASDSYDGVIKICSIKEDTSIECIRTIQTDEIGSGSKLYILGNDFIISRSEIEFKILDVKTYECIKSLKEDLSFERMTVTKNQNVITVIEDEQVNQVNLWKILV